MKFPRFRSLIWVGLYTAACLIVVACNKTGASKKPSPEAALPTRLDWNFKTLVDAYQKAGHTNPKWDEPAKRALTELARSRSRCTESNEAWGLIISTNCIAAMDAGCDDPMIRYLYIRFCMNQTNSPKAFADAFCETALEMEKSSYPNIRKFYEWQRAGQQVIYTYGYGTNVPPEVVRLGIWNLAATNLVDALSDRTMPPEEAYDACHEILGVWRGGKDQYYSLYHCIEKQLPDNWTNAPIILLLKGEAYIEMAWQARDGGYADKVTPEGWKLFAEHLAEADTALEKAWQLNSKDERIPIQMIRVDEGLQKSREEMELWFTRAMTINPNCYEACEHKLHYLYPQWYGSREAMVAFGRECLTSTNWGGNVPLILADAHREYWLYLNDSEEKSNYWKLPDVWPEIKAAYDRFFELNPDAIGYYHNYAWYAYHAEQWDMLNELIPKLGPVNYAYFGGRDEFDKMVRLAKEHGSKSK